MVSWKTPSSRTEPVPEGQPCAPSGNFVEEMPGLASGRSGSWTKRQPGAPLVGFQSEVSLPSPAWAFQEKLPLAVLMWSLRRPVGRV